MKLLLKSFSIIAVFIVAFTLSGCSNLVNQIGNVIYSPTLTHTSTNTSTPTLTPTQTATPTPTPTPTPQTLTINSINEICSLLSQHRETVIVEGIIFMPTYKVISYTWDNKTWKGMQLKQFLENEGQFLTILIPVGEGPNTMDTIPIPFDEKDLIIRDNDNRIIRHYHSVLIKGRVDYVESEEGDRCQLWLENIHSTTPITVLVPQEVSIAFLLKRVNVGSRSSPEYFTNCVLLAQKHQMVTVKGSIVSWGKTTQCNNVNCNFQFSNSTGTLWASFAYREGPNSVFKAEDNTWKFFDKSNNPISPANLRLTGVLYSLAQGCTLSVYEIDTP